MTVSNFRTVARVEPKDTAKDTAKDTGKDTERKANQVLAYMRQKMQWYDMWATNIGSKYDRIKKSLYIAAQWIYVVTKVFTGVSEDDLLEFAHSLLAMTKPSFHALMWDVHHKFNHWFSRGEISEEVMEFAFDLFHRSKNPLSEIYKVCFLESCPS